MNAIQYLDSQHDDVERLFDQFESSSGDDRAEIADVIIRSLRHHTTIEEEIFYPEVRDRIPDLESVILEDLEEHHAVGLLLDELEGLGPEDERFAAKVEVISEMVEHHVSEEREELFPKVSAELDAEALDELGRRLEERHGELSNADTLPAEQLSAQDDTQTKEQLYQWARQLDIPGRSSMSKEELAGAVAEAGSVR